MSRLTRTISTLRRPLQSRSSWRAVVTPPKPPPRITILVLWVMVMSHLFGSHCHLFVLVWAYAWTFCFVFKIGSPYPHVLQRNQSVLVLFIYTRPFTTQARGNEIG